MNKSFKISLGVFLILLVLIVIILIMSPIGTRTGTGKMLPPPPQNETESENLIINARNTIAESEELLSQAKAMDLNAYDFFDKLFVKRIIRKMEREINSAKKDLNSAEQFHSIREYYGVSASAYSVVGKTSYVSHNLRKILAGKTKKDWTKVDSVETTVDGTAIE